MKWLRKYWIALPGILGAVFLLLAQAGGSDKKPIVERVPSEDAPGGFQVVARPDTLPRDLFEAQSAPALALLPNRSGYPETRGRALPRAIARDLEEALSAWETYRVGSKESWQRNLRSYVVDESWARVRDRSDSIDRARACPEPSCQYSSRWFLGDFSRSAFLLELSDNLAWVVAYGAVVYRDSLGSRSSSERSYGVILRKESGRWKIVRLSAESLR